MIKYVLVTVMAICLNYLSAVYAAADCIDCHKTVTPNVVDDWRASKHSKGSVGCPACHGSAHVSEKDAGKAQMPTSANCSGCHKKQVDQYNKGKHSLAWSAMKAMPTVHWQPMAFIDGIMGCGGCHKLGNRSDDGHGMASCDACHTRHTFSVQEARQPQACQTCHMGFDHPQWEMYSSSKHGIRYLLKQNNVLPQTTDAPTCQTCHMKQGDHAVRTAWGFLAVRLPMAEDPQWAKDRAIILRALGVIDAQGKTTPRFEAIKAVDVVRLTQEDWRKERDRMLDTCSQCHSAGFAAAQLKKADQIIKDADHLMAEAITIVGDLYPKKYPDLLAFHDVSTAIEQKLFLMFSEYRMRAFQGAFHNNPDYTFWYGWSAMQQTLTEIKEMAAGMRKDVR